DGGTNFVRVEPSAVLLDDLVSDRHAQDRALSRRARLGGRGPCTPDIEPYPAVRHRDPELDPAARRQAARNALEGRSDRTREPIPVGQDRARAGPASDPVYAQLLRAADRPDGLVDQVHEIRPFELELEAAADHLQRVP